MKNYLLKQKYCTLDIFFALIAFSVLINIKTVLGIVIYVSIMIFGSFLVSFVQDFYNCL